MTIVLGIVLFLGFLSSILLVLSIVADLVSTSNITAFSEELIKQLNANSGMRVLYAFVASLCWTLAILWL